MENLLVKDNISISVAMEVLQKTSEKCLLVINNNGKFIGSLTDGDIRRFILKGNDLNSTIKKAYNKKPICLNEKEVNKKLVKDLLISQKIDLIPIVNDEMKLVDYITWTKDYGEKKLKQKNSLNASVVIMAGGKGTRLEPFTKILPKPLIPIHDKPIIEHIISRFTNFGINDFHLTVNFKSKILIAFFEELQPKYSLHFVIEKEPLGTAGSIRSFHNKFAHPFFVTNCDTVIDVDYHDLYNFHQSNGFEITIAASMKQYIIPFGTCNLNKDGHLETISEKPEFNFLVNTGLYVLSPEVINLIPKNKMYNITDLIEDTKKKGMKVGVYPISESSWIDVGQWSEYHKAVEKL
jgi:dTDP-glucose pyrophosphorylase